MTTTAENPTEEVDQPEVSPEPAGLEIEFCGEIYKVDPGKTFTIGRVGSLAIDDNPFLHRNFLVIESHNGLWWVTNVGSRIAVTVAETGLPDPARRPRYESRLHRRADDL